MSTLTFGKQISGQVRFNITAPPTSIILLCPVIDMKWSHKPIKLCIVGLVFENRPALYFCNYKGKKRKKIRMLDTLFIEDFTDSMEECFHFYNHD